jgi:hypothetical protein
MPSSFIPVRENAERNASCGIDELFVGWGSPSPADRYDRLFWGPIAAYVIAVLVLPLILRGLR